MKNKKIILVIITVVICIIIGVCLYFLLQNKSSQTQPTEKTLTVDEEKAIEAAKAITPDQEKEYTVVENEKQEDGSLQITLKDKETDQTMTFVIDETTKEAARVITLHNNGPKEE